MSYRIACIKEQIDKIADFTHDYYKKDILTYRISTSVILKRGFFNNIYKSK